MRTTIKNLLSAYLLLSLLLPLIGQAENTISQPAEFIVKRNGATAELSWRNPDSLAFSEIILFRSVIPIADYFSYEAVNGLCDKLYTGQAENYSDEGLAVNLPYYYILFARDRSGSTSDAIVIEKQPAVTDNDNHNQKTNSLAGVSSDTVNQVSYNEAGLVFNYNNPAEDQETDENTRRLALFIIVKSPHNLTNQDKNSISYFIRSGTPTTILLGTGERAGVLNSYLSVFDKLPRSQLEWQDVIKIANGRWPDERSIESEDRAANEFFSAIYERSPNMDNPYDSAAVTVIAYGLRPAARNLESEKRAIDIYRAIFGRSPSEAADWDLVRAIAYSGATR